LRVEKRVDSNHMLVCLELEPEEEKERRGGRQKGKRCSNGKRNIICWDTEARKEYWKKTEEKD